MFIFILKKGEIVPTVAREEIDHYWLLDDGVRVNVEMLDNDGVHFSTRKKAVFFRDKRSLS